MTDRAFKVKNGLELGAYAATIADTAVDVFVYDTSRDSDGGAWRHRTQHTSWYNETLDTATRGSRREFPAVAVIVAESGQVTIYDGDDPSLPMWATQAPGTVVANVKAVTARNGLVSVASTSGYLATFNFVKGGPWELYDAAGFDTWSGVLWSSLGSQINTDASKALVNGFVNDVAMTVLPNAPIDSATGLPVPTIAVATDGGVSVIKDDGTVVDITATVGPDNVYYIDFVEDGKIFFYWSDTSGSAGYGHNGVIAIPDSDISSSYYYGLSDLLEDYSYSTSFSASNDGPTAYPSSNNSSSTVALSSKRDIGSNTGLSRIYPFYPDIRDSLVAYTTSTYNTGWMNGDIKLAILSDTDDTDLVADGLGYDDFTTYADQAAAETAGYVFMSCTFDAANDQVDFSGLTAVLEIPTGLTAGVPAIVEITVSNYVSGGAAVQNSFVSLSAFDGSSLLGANGTSRFYIPSIGSLRIVTTSLNASIDAISVKLADADRSVNSVGLIVNGTVTRTAVATGADLVAYSGFSAANYLEQPYNSDLDFGTGDFCVMGWVKTSSAGIDRVFVRDSVPTAQNFSLYVDASGKAAFLCDDDTTVRQAVSSGSVNSGTWLHLCGVYDGAGGVFIYVDGILAGSATGSSLLTLDNASATLIIGNQSTGTLPFAGSLALIRISATVPSADQIAKIYEDEKFLFQDGAQATLYGASDAVTALAHDPVTDLLSVGTSAGRSDFQGLRRVNNTTNAVGTAISAVDGLIVEE